MYEPCRLLTQSRASPEPEGTGRSLAVEDRSSLSVLLSLIQTLEATTPAYYCQ